MANTLRSIHGAQAHTGKRPKGYISTNDKIIKNLSEEERLTLELQEAIEKEEFEEAARLRDLIRSLKGGNQECLNGMNRLYLMAMWLFPAV